MFIKPYIINSYFYCKNRVYIELNSISKTEHENVSIGKVLDESNNKIKFDGFEIDGIDLKNKLIIESKKSKSNFDGNKYQLIYYIYLLKHIYKDFNGKLIFKNNNEEILIEYNKEEELKLLLILEKIKEIKNFDINLINSNKCELCGYFEFCHI